MPGATWTVSPDCAALMASWIVGYCSLGARSVPARAEAPRTKTDRDPPRHESNFMKFSFSGPLGPSPNGLFHPALAGVKDGPLRRPILHDGPSGRGSAGQGDAGQAERERAAARAP